MSLPRCALSLAVITALVSIAPPAAAVVQSQKQRLCIEAMFDGGRKIAKKQGRQVGACAKRGGRDRLPAGEGVYDCLVSDPDGKVARAQTALLATETKTCTEVPDFGFAGAAAVGEAAGRERLALTNLALGQPTYGLRRATLDQTRSICTAKIADGTQRLLDAHLKTFGECALRGIRRGEIVSAADLGTICWPQVTADAFRKIGRASAKLEAAVAGRKCDGVDLNRMLVGGCLDPTLPECIAGLVECRACHMLDQWLDLELDCDLLDDATANASCVPAGCGDGVLQVELGEECDDGNLTGGDGCSATCQIDGPGQCFESRDPHTLAPWVLCAIDGASAWVSMDRGKAGFFIDGGPYHPEIICQQLGFAAVSAWDGTSGRECGTGLDPLVTTSCAALGTRSFSNPWTGTGNQTPDAFGEILANTVMWECTN